MKRVISITVPIVVLAAVWLAMLLLGGGPLDRQVYEVLYAGGSPALIELARGLSLIGQPPVLITAGFVCAWWLWRTHRGRLALILLLVTLIGRGLSELQKYEIARVRPNIEPQLVIVKTSSFPSGHAASSMIFGLTVALAVAAGTRWERVAVASAILLSLLIGTSRVMLGVHWPSDVIGGWSFGLLWVLLSFPFAVRLATRGSSSSDRTAV